jgi:hypothetical protein
VKEIELVASSKRKPLIRSEYNTQEDSMPRGNSAFNFGPSYPQLQQIDEVSMISSGVSDGASGVRVSIISYRFLQKFTNQDTNS